MTKVSFVGMFQPQVHPSAHALEVVSLHVYYTHWHSTVLMWQIFEN